MCVRLFDRCSWRPFQRVPLGDTWAGRAAFGEAIAPMCFGRDVYTLHHFAECSRCAGSLATSCWVLRLSVGHSMMCHVDLTCVCVLGSMRDLVGCLVPHPETVAV